MFVEKFSTIKMKRQKSGSQGAEVNGFLLHSDMKVGILSTS